MEQLLDRSQRLYFLPRHISGKERAPPGISRGLGNLWFVPFLQTFVPVELRLNMARTIQNFRTRDSRNWIHCREMEVWKGGSLCGCLNLPLHGHNLAQHHSWKERKVLSPRCGCRILRGCFGRKGLKQSTPVLGKALKLTVLS